MDELRPDGRQRRTVAGGPLDGKPFAVTGYEVWCAWRQVRENNGAPGVDGSVHRPVEERWRDNLYKLWNRMSSGSYFPGPVRARGDTEDHGEGVRLGSGCRRKRHSAGSSSDLSGFVVITHPFHPLRGQRVEVLFSRRRGGQVVLACESAGLGRVTVFESWTDRVASPAGGRLSAEGLAALDTLARSMEGR